MNWFYKIMGLKDKVSKPKETETVDNKLTSKEVTFIITKLRQGTYQGTEFETFYQVMSKLQSIGSK